MAQAQLNSVSMNVSANAAMNKVTGAVARTSAVMTAMNRLINVPELSAQMRVMSQEMMKAGIIEEMVDDAMATMEDGDTEELADAEVEKLVMEITMGHFDKVSNVPTTKVVAKGADIEVEAGEAEETETASIEARLHAL